MKIIVSFINSKEELQDPNRLIGIFDTNKKTHLRWVELKGLQNSENITHATGMCYNYYNDCFYAGLIAKEHRLASRLLIINRKTGERKINKLSLTKSIHGICCYPNSNILFVCSTQNDLITAITTNNVEYLTEDVYYDFLGEHRIKCELHNEYKCDDNYHINNIGINKSIIYASMFLRYTHLPIKIYNIKINKSLLEESGAIINIDLNRNLVDKKKIIIRNLSMPHTIFFNSKGELLTCISADFKFINVTTNQSIELDGYTRGICEDQQKGGYWVGISAYRKYNSVEKKWVTINKPGISLKGSKIQFVDYDFNLKDSFDLSKYGVEIFDILKFRKGKYVG